MGMIQFAFLIKVHFCQARLVRFQNQLALEIGQIQGKIDPLNRQGPKNTNIILALNLNSDVMRSIAFFLLKKSLSARCAKKSSWYSAHF